jgi:hypothetical protein
MPALFRALQSGCETHCTHPCEQHDSQFLEESFDTSRSSRVQYFCQSCAFHISFQASSNCHFNESRLSFGMAGASSSGFPLESSCVGAAGSGKDSLKRIAIAQECIDSFRSGIEFFFVLTKARSFTSPSIDCPTRLTSQAILDAPPRASIKVRRDGRSSFQIATHPQETFV